jgi:hypothetical protein
MRYEWDERKRQANLEKHGLDFLRAGLVLESPYRMEIATKRQGEKRIQAFAYVFDVLAVLTVVTTKDAKPTRIISFRKASRAEKEGYYEWLEIDKYDP